MSKNKDLESIFLKAIKDNNIAYNGKVFNLGTTALCADYIFGDKVVIVMDKYIAAKVALLQEFHKQQHHYSILLLTNKCDKLIDGNYYTALYDLTGLPDLIKLLKANT